MSHVWPSGVDAVAHLLCDAVVGERMGGAGVYKVFLSLLIQRIHERAVDGDVRHVLECYGRHWHPLSMILANALQEYRAHTS